MKHVKGFITRKTMLYETGVEYGDYTMNHVLGCAHGCKYPCYAFQQKKRFGNVKSYEEWLQPYLVSNTLELLDKEIPKLKDNIKSVQLCFTTDPFMYGYDEIRNMSIAAIRKLNGRHYLYYIDERHPSDRAERMLIEKRTWYHTNNA